MEYRVKAYPRKPLSSVPLREITAQRTVVKRLRRPSVAHRRTLRVGTNDTSDKRLTRRGTVHGQFHVRPATANRPFQARRNDRATLPALGLVRDAERNGIAGFAERFDPGRIPRALLPESFDSAARLSLAQWRGSATDQTERGPRSKPSVFRVHRRTGKKEKKRKNRENRVNRPSNAM